MSEKKNTIDLINFREELKEFKEQVFDSIRFSEALEKPLVFKILHSLYYAIESIIEHLEDKQGGLNERI